MTDNPRMNDRDMDALIQTLRNGPQMGRLQHDEIRDALRAAEVAGYSITVPANLATKAPTLAPGASIFAPAANQPPPVHPESMTTTQQVAAGNAPPFSPSNPGVNPAPKIGAATPA